MFTFTFNSPLFAQFVLPSNGSVTGTTGTGLDRLVEIITEDQGLNGRISIGDIAEGAENADGINALIVEAIRGTGTAYNGQITPADIRDISRYINENNFAEFVVLHGDDEGNEETGFHLVQNDGASTLLFGNNAVDTVADGLYHLGFEVKRNRLTNEDGNRNATVEQAAYWLDSLLTDDLAGTGLIDPLVANPYDVGDTGTGLDQLVEIIFDDPGLNEDISTSDISRGASAANQLNQMIVDAVVKAGLANDGVITGSDVREINLIIQSDPALYAGFIELHGDDEGDEETGFHLVQNDGAETEILDGRNAVNTVADGIYHIGFDIKGNNLTNEDGNNNASVKTAAHWIDALLTDDLTAGTLVNPDADPYGAAGLGTGTGLDLLLEIIRFDDGLNEKISVSDMRGGLIAADGMNKILVDAIFETGAANDGVISEIDLEDINAWIRDPANTAEGGLTQLELWTQFHGDDEGDEETGFHLVQDDGDRIKLFGRDAVDTVADGLYHIGFEIERGRFLNEDGNKNASVETAAGWLNALLEADLADPNSPLKNADFGRPPEGTPAANLLFEPVTVEGFAPPVNLENPLLLDAMRLESGTFAFSFTAETPEGNDRDVIFSKDWNGRNEPGHITAWVQKNELEVRLQNPEGEIELEAEGIEPGITYNAAVSFGPDGAALYLNGVRTDSDRAFTTDLTENPWSLLVGENGWGRSASNPGWRADRFDGEIENFVLTDRALFPAEIASLPDELASMTVLDLGLPEPPEPGPLPEIVLGPLSRSNADGRVEVDDPESLSLLMLERGTYAFSFKAAGDIGRSETLFSKDARGFDDGGHLTAWLDRDELIVRFQSDDRQVFLKEDGIEGDTDYNVAFTFGDNGIALYLDGVFVDGDNGFVNSMASNDWSLVLGESTRKRRLDDPDLGRDPFDGEISDFAVYNGALDAGSINAMHGAEAAGLVGVATTLDEAANLA